MTWQMAPPYSTRSLRGTAGGIREFPVFGNQKRIKLWVAPLTQAGQIIADPPATQIEMLRQQRTDLRQLRRADETALNDARFKHGLEYA
jgi:hypothetical protein